MAFGAGIRGGAGAAWHSPVVRFLAGVAISLVFLAVTISRVDLAEVAAALAGAAPAGVLLALALVVVELVIRAERWRILLAPAAAVPFRSTFAYLSIGYFANTLLPARLGDAARSYLAGRSFGISPLMTLGTIVVERVFDAVVILAVVIMAALAVAHGREIAGSAAAFAAAVALGIVIVGTIALLALRSRLREHRHGRLVRRVLSRIAEGAAAVRRPSGSLLVLGLTILPFGVAVCAFGATSSALGLSLGPADWAVILGVLALSTALPAAPGSLGTYEFVGVTALGVLGVGPSQALAATVLIHVIATIPPALIGLVATLVLHVRITDLDAAATSELSMADEA